jgi:hypothetical protein
LISDFSACGGINTAPKAHAKNQKPAIGHAGCGQQIIAQQIIAQQIIAQQIIAHNSAWVSPCI